MNSTLDRNPDGTIKIYNWEDLPPVLKNDYEQLKHLKFILGSYVSSGENHGYIQPVSTRHAEGLPHQLLEEFVTQKMLALMNP
jgi:hypothetical protein